jgi:hypothetical protein
MAPKASMPYRFAENMMSFFFKNSLGVKTPPLFPVLMARSCRRNMNEHITLKEKYKNRKSKMTSLF